MTVFIEPTATKESIGLGNVDNTGDVDKPISNDTQTALNTKSGTGRAHGGVYEPADLDIQTHITSAHAPVNAQKNSDILKSEIEAVLTGELSSHSHAGGSQAFPVGSVFLSVVSTNPATLLGCGTWSQIAGGRVLIGQTGGDVDFDTPEETGGAKTKTLAVNEIPAHTHTQRYHATSSGALAGNTSHDVSSSNPQNSQIESGSAGGGAAFSLMNPYLVVYIWKRTA